ncbi:RNA polymerase II transcriptional coactivator KIWI [Zea mays]|uniref:RNA polymerase II transcriptional coactivator KIWI n=1 Tax=Zea mays TaxID=4577 RepID=A0A1D6HAE4_MAIZE|nr:RNA polymerase II transcriptional coactivator KIWI [Zea mays]
MWGKGKKRFGGGGSGEPAAKRQAARDDGPSESAEDGTVVAEISKNKKVSVRSWKGRVFVDLREFYFKDGKTLPTRKDRRREIQSKHDVTLSVASRTEHLTASCRRPMQWWWGDEGRDAALNDAAGESHCAATLPEVHTPSILALIDFAMYLDHYVNLKRISLQLDQWKILKDNIKAINEAIEENT